MGRNQTVYSCFCRWRDDGTLERIFHALGANAELEELNIDSTTSKASEQASRGPRKRLKRDVCIGRTRGGKNTKIHALVNRREYLSACRYLLATALIVTRPSPFCRSLEKSRAATFWVIGRMGQRKIRLYLTEQGAQYTIPPTKNLLHPWKYDRQTYKRRNVIERCFCRLKDFRRIATRYDKESGFFSGFSFPCCFCCHFLHFAHMS